MYYMIANVYVLYDIIVYVHVYVKACACMARTLSLPWQMTSKFRIWTLLLNYQPLVKMIANGHFTRLFHFTKTSIGQCMYIKQVNI